MAFDIANPFEQQLVDLPGRGSSARAAIEQIYKDLHGSTVNFQASLRGLDTRVHKRINNAASAARVASAKQQQGAIADILATARQSSGNVDSAEASFLSNLATRKSGQINAKGLADYAARGQYQGALSKLDSQYVKDLKASAIREKQARQAELEQNLLDFGTGLRTNAALFDAQTQQLNQTQNLLGQGLSSLGGTGGGGPIQQSNGSYSVGAAHGLSADEAWIITHESGGDPMAQNRRSTAHGIGQLLDSTDRAYSAKLGFSYRTTDPNQQLAMFRAYIRDRYGNAANAKAFWQAHGWY